MDFAIAALDFANIINFMAVLFLMRAIIKDRKVLRGFSVSGAFLTFVAVLSFETAYFFIGNLVSLALGLVSLVFWLLAFVFTFRKVIYERKHPPEKTPSDGVAKD
jgi:Ca2+/Na+ antiporter